MDKFENVTALNQWFFNVESISPFHFSDKWICRKWNFFFFCNKCKNRVCFVEWHATYWTEEKAEDWSESYQHNLDELKKLDDEMWPYALFLTGFLFIFSIKNKASLFATKTVEITVTWLYKKLLTVTNTYENLTVAKNTLNFFISKIS